MALGEFELIARYFSRPGAARGVLLGVGDDAALLDVPAGQTLVAATDTLVEGRHFMVDAPPQSVGHQVLAVNLSDLAAMGASPAWALLSLSLPDADPDWLAGFAEGLYALAERSGTTLVGGDTVRGPRVITITALGLVPVGTALLRSGARVGDRLFVSGSPGEAAAGLALLQAGGADPLDPLVQRHRYAQPRLALGQALRGRASAAMDVSDGLLGDLGKLCAASGVGARLALDRLPVSQRLTERFSADRCEQFVLSGGDDYELLFTVPASGCANLAEQLAETGPVTCIGEIVAGNVIECQRAGRTVAVADGGYDHFG